MSDSVNPYAKWGWKSCPFVLSVDPSTFTGYEEQLEAINRHIQNKHKIALLTGPTGSGKTTLLKYIERLSDHNKLYVSKPPTDPKEFAGLFVDQFGIGFFDRLLGRYPTLYTLPRYINRKLKGSHMVFMIDEAHETNKDVLEWLRVIVDQIDSVSVIIAGLPALEKNIKEQLETLNQRITTRIELSALSKSESSQLIAKRIASMGGSGIAPFTESAIDKIYDRTGGFPREVLKMCDRLVNTALERNLESIDATMIEEEHREIEVPDVRVDQPSVTFSPKPPSDEQFANLSYKQKKILEILSKQDWLTPTSISDQSVGQYASKGHAIRSINNILHRLMMDGYVQRESRGKAFMYALTPKVRTLFVQS